MDDVFVVTQRSDRRLLFRVLCLSFAIFLLFCFVLTPSAHAVVIESSLLQSFFWGLSSLLGISFSSLSSGSLLSGSGSLTDSGGSDLMSIGSSFVSQFSSLFDPFKNSYYGLGDQTKLIVNDNNRSSFSALLDQISVYWAGLFGLDNLRDYTAANKLTYSSDLDFYPVGDYSVPMSMLKISGVGNKPPLGVAGYQIPIADSALWGNPFGFADSSVSPPGLIFTYDSDIWNNSTIYNHVMTGRDYVIPVWDEYGVDLKFRYYWSNSKYCVDVLLDGVLYGTIARDKPSGSYTSMLNPMEFMIFTPLVNARSFQSWLSSTDDYGLRVYGINSSSSYGRINVIYRNPACVGESYELDIDIRNTSLYPFLSGCVAAWRSGSSSSPSVDVSVVGDLSNVVLGSTEEQLLTFPTVVDNPGTLVNSVTQAGVLTGELPSESTVPDGGELAITPPSTFGLGTIWYYVTETYNYCVSFFESVGLVFTFIPQPIMYLGWATVVLVIVFGIYRRIIS